MKEGLPKQRGWEGSPHLALFLTFLSPSTPAATEFVKKPEDTEPSGVSFPADREEQGSEVKSLSRVQLFATPWTVACQAPLSMEFSRQEYQSGLPFPPPGHLPDPGIEPVSPALAGRFFTTSTTWEVRCRKSGGYQDQCWELFLLGNINVNTNL